MDPASIVGVCLAGAQLSSSLYKFVRKVVDAPKEIAEIASDLKDVSSVFRQLSATIEAHASLIEDELIETARKVLVRFQDLQRDIKEIISKTSRLRRPKWLFDRDRATGLVVRVKVLKDLIHIMISTAHFAISADAASERKKEASSSAMLYLRRLTSP